MSQLVWFLRRLDIKMGESAKHVDLINLMKDIICSKENIDAALMLSDDPSDRKNGPPTINGFKPDIYYDFNQLLIIGEAKTKDDLLNDHTKKQLEAYIKLCANYNGKSRLYLAVPWMESVLANNLIKKISKNIGVSVTYFVVDELQKL